jgi:hypothetical protein
MTENTITEQKMEATTEAVQVPEAKPKPRALIRTFVRATITKMDWARSAEGVGLCRVTVVGDPAGSASSPPRVTLYIRDGGEADNGELVKGDPLRDDEARRCRDGLRVGDVIEAVGVLGPERERAMRQEVIVTEEVKLRWRPGLIEEEPADPPTAPRERSQRRSPATPPRRTRVGGGRGDQAAAGGGATRHERPRVVLFSGSRRWEDPDPVTRDLETLPAGSLVIEGGAPGLDTIVRREAPRLGLHVATVPALWSYFDKPAGYRRNEAMLMLQPEELFAYPLGESPGTRHMIRSAEAECVQVREV